MLLEVCVGVGVGVWVGGRVNGGQQHDNSPARSRSDFRVGDFTVPTKPFTGLDIQTKGPILRNNYRTAHGHRPWALQAYTAAEGVPLTYPTDICATGKTKPL